MIVDIKEYHRSLAEHTDKIIEFCYYHKVEVFLGEDRIYQCWIDNEGSYATSLTAFEALYEGIFNYGKIK